MGKGQVNTGIMGRYSRVMGRYSGVIEGDVGKKTASGLLILLGSVLLVYQLQNFSPDTDPKLVLLGIVPPMVLAVIIMYAGTELSQSAANGEESWRITLWAIATAAFLTTGVYLYFLYETLQGIRTASPLHLLTNTATGGVTIGLLIGYHDYRRQRKATSLTQEKDRLNALFQNIGAPAAMLEFQDDDLAIKRVNSTLENTFSLPPDELIDQPITKLPAPPTEEVMEHIEREDCDPQKCSTCKQRTCVQGLEYRTPTQTLHFMVQVSPFTAGDTEGAFLSYVDNTDNKLKQQKLTVMNRVLRHDLRNRINVIMGNAELLRNKLPEEETEEVDTVISNAEELVRLGNRVKTLEKKRDETYPVNLSRETLDQINHFKDEHPKTEVETDLPEELWIQGGPLLNLAIESLLENTVDHNDLPEDEVEITVEAEEDVNGTAAINIRDNGPGMPEAVLEVLERGEETSLDHSEGISLWIVKWILNVMGGELDFEQNEPRGTIATIRLKTINRPSRRDTESEEPAPKRSA